MKRMLLALLVTIAALLAPAEPARAQDKSAVIFDAEQARLLREEAASARRQAETRLEQARRLRALEKTARDNARTSQAPADKRDWEARAGEHGRGAATLEREARQELERAGEKEARAAALERSTATAREKMERKAPEKATAPVAARPAEVRTIARMGLLRVWRHVDRGWPFVIVQDQASRIEAHTESRVWNGMFRPATPDDPKGERGPLVVFTYRPKAAEMNPEIPEWARKAVEGKLEWRIELEDDGTCGSPRLTARWFKGEVSWREAGGGEPARASISGRGAPHRFELAASEDAAFDTFTSARLFLQLPGRSRAAGGPSAVVAPADASPEEHDPYEFPVAALVKLQPFFVRVVLPPELAQKQGPTLQVTVTGKRGGGKTTMTLVSGAQRHMRSVVYSHTDPVTIADDLDWLGHDRDPPFLSVNYILGNSGSRLPLDIANGEVVELAFGDAVQAVPIYTSWVQAGIARHAEAKERLRAVLSAMLQDPKYDAAQKKRVNRYLQMVKNLDAMLASPKLHDYIRYRLGSAYLHEVTGLVGQTDDEAAAEAAVLLAHHPLRESERDGRSDPRGYFDGVVWTSNHERAVATRAIVTSKTEQRDVALNEIPRAISFGMYAAVANVTQVGGMYTTATSKDIFGKHVSPWERLMAGVGVAAGAVLQHGLPVMINHRLGPGSMSPSLNSSSWGAVRFSRPGAPVSMGEMRIGDAPSATNLPKSIKPEHLRSARGSPAGRGKAGTVGCAIRAGSDRPSPGGIGADAADLHAYYGPNAKFVDAGPEPGHLPQKTGSCLVQVDAKNVHANTNLRTTESGTFRTLVEKGIAKDRKFHDPGFSYTADEKIGFLELAGATTARVSHRLPLTTIDGMRQLGWHVTDVIAPRSGGLHAVDVVKVVKDGVGKIVAVQFYDPAFARIVEVPACEYVIDLDPPTLQPTFIYTWAKPSGGSSPAGPPPPSGGAPIGMARPPKGSRPSAIPEQGGKTLHELLDAHFRAKGIAPRDMPPMHVTNRDALLSVVATGVLELHAGSGASWSLRGTLREGDVAIRVKPGHEKYVEFVKTGDNTGLVPHYWAEGVRQRGEFKTYIPAKHLEFFNARTGEFRPIPGSR